MFSNCRLLGAFALWAGIATAAPNINLQLPWGTWQAFPYPDNTDIYMFQNVRFGGVPARLGNSSYPAPISNPKTVQNSSYGPSCHQINRTALSRPPGGRSDIVIPINVPPPDMDQSEDCLFLDIYVPAKALEPRAPKLPVVVWFYGGAYAFGSKLFLGPPWPLYTGQGIIEQAERNDVIFVAGNYRMGAFGWLAGTFMEQKGLPNAGLYDQRLLLQFVQDYIGQVGGDKTSVSAWGESAGAGSILHHIIQKNGTRDPLFHKAFLQSPAYEWQWDRSGTLNEATNNFFARTKCLVSDPIGCIRNYPLDNQALIDANQALFEDVKQTGLYPVGPSVDGIWVDKLPPVQFAEKNYWQKLDSIMVSHVGNESGSFLPQEIINNPTNFTFQEWVNEFMPEDVLAPIKSQIYSQYNCAKAPWNGNYIACVEDLISHSTFVCNTRQLYDAFKPKAWMMQYSFPYPYAAYALHATDLIPTFVNSATDIKAFILALDKNITNPGSAADAIGSFRETYQDYLASYAVYGDPNKAKPIIDRRLAWSKATDNGEQVQGLLEVRLKETLDHPFFDNTLSDNINTASNCTFWTGIAKQIDAIYSKAGLADVEKISTYQQEKMEL